MASSYQDEKSQDSWFLKSTVPVFLPDCPILTAPDDEFEAYLQNSVKPVATKEATPVPGAHDDYDVVTESAETDVLSEVSTTAEIRDNLDDMVVADNVISAPDIDHPFMKGLLSPQQDRLDENTESMENKMLTKNGDVAYRSTTEPLLDLFAELEDVVSGPRLRELLESSWRSDPTATLKVIFNARSIHLGKASRQTFYRCAGWLAKNHPQTLVANLPWLSRPVIQKKLERKSDKEKTDVEDLVIIDEDLDEEDPTRFDVKYGVAHGYWKDLLNLLALCVNGRLDVLANPREILNVEQKSKAKWPKTQEDAKFIRRETRDTRHNNAVTYFHSDPVYRGLHLAVARLFAAQLKTDIALLKCDDAASKRKISLCAKWAPSSDRFHDKHTHVASSIAEILHPLSDFTWFDGYDPNNVEQRTLYLRHAREAYRKDVSALRKHLECVERDITANTYKNIKYDRVPSTAMNNYAPLFATKDTDRFEKYIDKVAAGKARISGATLLPSSLIKTLRWNSCGITSAVSMAGDRRKLKGTKVVVQAKIEDMAAKSLDLQWNTLVQRIKDSGTMDNCIAVADVSGSMQSPTFPDGTSPLDSSIGLSLLIAEVAKPPFGGAFITFSDNPQVQRVDLSVSLGEKFGQLIRADWAASTDFVAVFERLILPMAIENKLKQEDMVKRIFVFSDMHFNTASRGSLPGSSHYASGGAWSSSYERIEQRFRDAGYEMPELVFWNLAGGGRTWASPGVGDHIAPKPVTANIVGTALVSGYSQGMLKVFLDSGSLGDEKDGPEEEIVEKIGDDGEVVVEKVKRQKLDPMSIVNKAIGHKAYSMLRVVD